MVLGEQCDRHSGVFLLQYNIGKNRALARRNVSLLMEILINSKTITLSTVELLKFKIIKRI